MLRSHCTDRIAQTVRVAWAAQPSYDTNRRQVLTNRTGCCVTRHFWASKSVHAKSSLTMTSVAEPSIYSCLRLLRKAAPALDGTSYKGQAGKIAVVGGSVEYTGAPYFAAMAAMRGGGELSFVYCAESAASAIKAYSPDLIVYPGFAALGKDCKSLERMHAIVLGPGLGRTEEGATVVDKVISYVCENPKPLVVDADGLWFIAQTPRLREMIRDGPPSLQVFLTPNKVEMDRLQSALQVATGGDITKWFQGRVVVVQKGPIDRITGKSNTIEVSSPGALKRVGGQGDFLAGLLALCSAWMAKKRSDNLSAQDLAIEDVAPAVCACLLTRVAARRAFLKHGRSLLASDIIPFIGSTIEEVLAANSLIE